MTKELNENSGFKISIKTLIGIGTGMAVIISMWFVLQADIAEAKKLPEHIPDDVLQIIINIIISIYVLNIFQIVFILIDLFYFLNVLNLL